MVDINAELEDFDDQEIDSSEILSETEAEPLCEFITGEAGTGKTFSVKAKIEEDPTYGALCATTGIAAVNLGSTTINSLLGFFDTDSMRDAYQRGSLNAKIHKIALKGCQRIVLDECFDFDQTIATEKGWKKIGAVVHNRSRIRVWSYRDGIFELKPIVGWFAKASNSPLLRIDAGRTDSRRCARRITCTPNHKILTADGYREAGQLLVGDRVIVRSAALTDLQRSMVLGSLLGDASLSHTILRNSPQVTFIQGEAQLNYLLYKKEILGTLAGSMQQGGSGFKPINKVYSLYMNVVDGLWEISNEMILLPPTKTKAGEVRRYWEPTSKYLSWLNEAALAFWYGDDGSTATSANGKRSAFIHTSPMCREKHEEICAFLLNRFGLTAKIQPDSRGHLRLAFGQESTALLLPMIAPYLPASMNYKVPGACGQVLPFEQPMTYAAPIRRIEEAASTPDHGCVYDIEVQDNHNYLAGNVVVSNCSMMDKFQLDILYSAVKDVNQYKSTKKPMGITLVGDLCQLPPVCKGAKPGANPLWIFKADCWPKFAENTQRLTKIWRQNDPEFLQAINHLRRGEGGPAAEILKTLTRFEPTTNGLFEGTTILPLNDEVDRHNFVRLGRVNGKPCVVQSRRWGKQSGEWRKNIPESMQLKIGAFVMILANDSPSFSYVNGDTGYIRDFDGNSFTVELIRTQKTVQIGLLHRTAALREPPMENVDGPWTEASAFSVPFGRVSYDDDKELWHHGGVLYYPLRLAWASTVHKSQGLSLDKCQIDLRGGFCGAPAMTYVAISRCRTPGGLRLVGTPDILTKRCNTDAEVAPWL